MMKSLLISSVLAIFSIQAAFASDFTHAKADPDAACERLDVKRLNVTPAALSQGELIAYVDGYVRGSCKSSASSVASVERLLDLAYLNERLQTVPSGLLFSGAPNFDRMDRIKGRLKKTLKKGSRLPAGSVDYSAHDAAMVMFLSCQMSAYINLELCPSEQFEGMKAVTEYWSFEQRSDTVSPLIDLYDRKENRSRRYERE